MTPTALIFDLDGVITDTAEYHYQAWQRLADEESLPFDRAANERCRGISRRESLLVVLGGRPATDEQMQAMMARKQRYYEESLDRIGPNDLLPGVASLLDTLDAAGIPYALASASKNARPVCERLGIAHRLAALADGYSVERQKPYPDLFRFAAAGLGAPAAGCLVVEDAAAGVEAALAAGMPALALGPADRFGGLLGRGRVTRRDDLRGVTLDELATAAAFDPVWHVVQTGFAPAAAAELHHTETIFTLGNGRFATRGTFEEGYPGESALTFVHGIWDDMPIVFTELVNLPNWLRLNLTIDGDDFRLDQGRVLDFRRYTDLRAGVLRRAVLWQAPNGKTVDLLFERFIAYPRQHVAAIRVLVTAVSHPCAVAVRAGIDGHVANQDLLHLNLADQGKNGDAVWLRAHTRHTGRAVAVAASLAAETSAADSLPLAPDLCPGYPALSAAADLKPGQTLQLDKLVAITTDRDPSQTSEVADTSGVSTRALAELSGATYDRLRAEHVAAWGAVWREGDVHIEGDEEAQLAMRFNLFQLLAAAPQHDERVSIGAKTLSGYGYRGHVFWDTEIFILPYLIYTFPTLARNMLMYRYHGLPGARRKAAGNGFPGAQFPWESAETGDEVTPTWVPHFSDPKKLVRIWTGDIQIHITADIAYAIMQYWRVTGDDAFLRDYGAEMVLDGARFWGERAELEEADGRRRYAIRGVIGPDEYHEHVDNNSFTNYMCRWHLQTALGVYEWLRDRHPAAAADLADRLRLTPETLERWQDVIEHITLLYDADTGLFDQFEGFFDRERIDPEVFRTADRSLQVIFGIEGANERQVLKQADVIMLLCLFRDAFDSRVWQTNWDTYMPITDHRYGSSLGPSFHAWAACEVGLPDEAYAHFMLAARADLRNPRGNAGDGIHAASTGGVWQAAVFGFAGLRPTVDGWTLRPQLPRHWQRLAFTYRANGQPVEVDIQRDEGGEYRVRHTNR